MKVLCVAEKPSISKSITQILSGGQFTTRNTRSKFVKNYDFDYPQTRDRFTVTCVAGHLMRTDFIEGYRNWNSCDPFALFDATITTEVAPDKKAIADNIVAEAGKAQILMIWTDCDREGENIGAEIVKMCRIGNTNIQVKRARFSAIIAQEERAKGVDRQIHHAAQHPVNLDLRQVAAVDARIELDLRIGAAFTRMQTLSIRPRIQELNDIVSYGPCQFPTLGFVVARYNQVKTFVPENFWFIFLSVTRNGAEVPFTWKRGHIFEMEIALAIYEGALEKGLAKVTKVTEKEKKKWKPLPLTTVELQKSGSRLLKLAPKKILDIAESLYQDGFLSYPRTETDQFDPHFNFMSLIEKQTVNGDWGAFAATLKDGGFATPRRGKNNDQAHPPIHPTAHAGNLTGDHKRVYELVTRRFLACCSKDALGFETTIDISYGEEEFYASGLRVLERNYLEVYPYDKWNDKELPDFTEEETFVPNVCELRDGTTTKPNLLTEADLVGLMDKNGIGTDATIAQHIDTIIDRGYVVARMEGSTKYLIPSTLGMGLVDGYNAIEFDRSLSKPQLRRATERSMVEVCQGNKTKNDMLIESIEQYKDMYIKAKGNFEKVMQSVLRYLNTQNGSVGNRRGAPRRGRGRGGGAPGRRGDDDSDDDMDGSGNGVAGNTSARGKGRGKGKARATTTALNRTIKSAPMPPPPIPLLKAEKDPPKPSKDLHLSSPGAGPSRHVLLPTPPTSTTASASPSVPPPTRIQVPALFPLDFRCYCGEPAVNLTVMKEGPNKGRPFRKCGRPRDDNNLNAQCHYFEWADTEDGTGGGLGAASGTTVPVKQACTDQVVDNAGARKCKCNLLAANRTVTKEGANKGKKFWTCPHQQNKQCGYFEWEDTPDGGNGNTGGVPLATLGMVSSGQTVSVENKGSGSGSRGGPSGACFKCGQGGHWANSCPNERSASKPKSKRTTSTGSGALSTVECYKCHQTGHYSRDCPGAVQGGVRPSSRSSSATSARGGKRRQGSKSKGSSTKKLKSKASGGGIFGAVDDYL